MARREYEYFGNQNPTLNGKYNRGRVDAQRLANDKAVISNASTPFGIGYTIGSAIGNAWADNYNDRGISKGRAEMQDALNGYLGQYSQQPKTEVEQGGVLNNAMTGNQPSEEMLNNNSARIQGGVLNGVENVIAPMSPQDAYKAYKNDAWVAKYRGADPNPDSTAISVKNDTREMNQMGDNINFDNVDKEQAREYVRKQLEDKGRTPYQIDQVLGQFDSVYDSKYGKWKANKATDLFEKGRAAANEGRWDDAQNFYMAGSKYDPKMASMQIQGLQNSYNRKLQAQQMRDKEYMAGYMRDNDGNLVINSKHPIWSSRKYGGGSVSGIGIGTGRGSGSGSASSNTNGRWIGRRDGITDKQYTNALSSLKYYEGKEELDPTERKAYEVAKDRVAKYNSANHGAIRGYNIDNQDDVENYIRGVAYNIRNNPNASGTDILNTLRNDGIMESPYWDDKYLELLGLSADGNNND